MKQVIVMRKDLNMRKGKMVAQGAHASMGAILRNAHTSDGYPLALDDNIKIIPMDEPMTKWLDGKFTKICVGVDSEEELLELYEEIKDVEELKHHALITDEGRTEFGGQPTHTCLAIGPADPEILDRYTGELKLL